MEFNLEEYNWEVLTLKREKKSGFVPSVLITLTFHQLFIYFIHNMLPSRPENVFPGSPAGRIECLTIRIQIFLIKEGKRFVIN